MKRAVALATLLLMPAIASAQNATIAGVVKDTSGGLLPGVSVEASSPALIEKVRSASTDGSGQYKIVDLRPGVYVVTFTLPGFNVVRREGIELTTGFTANVNADMSIGSLQETVTVNAPSPVVDTQNVSQQRVMTADAIGVLPSGRSAQALVQLIPGMTVLDGGRPILDVGGLAGEGAGMAFHGSRESDQQPLLNGMPFHNSGRTGPTLRTDMSSAAEVNFTLGGKSAEHRQGGPVMNIISKDGGNRFTGSFLASYSNKSLQSDNLDDELRARDLLSANAMDRVFDYGGGVGGPIKRDKIWFYGSIRYWGVDNVIAGVFSDSNTADFAYTPDLNRPAHDLQWTLNETAKLTWQLTPKHKLMAYALNQPRGSYSTPPFGGASIVQAEALTPQNVITNDSHQILWSSAFTNRLFLEAGTSQVRMLIDRPSIPEVPDDRYSIREASTNTTFNAPNPETVDKGHLISFKTAVSYVTGSHSIKVGVTADLGFDGPDWTIVNNDMTLTLLNGVPNQITLLATPRAVEDQFVPMLGLFAQDQWTVNRLTLNAGLRFDYHNASVPAQHVPARRFVPAFDFAEVKDVPNWKDLSPRLGVSYDPSGTGKTAIKVNLSRYIQAHTTALARASNPLNTTVNSATRNWTDLNGNFIPECDFLDPVANGECERLSDVAFGTQRITTFYDQDVLQGYGKRPGNWETSIGLQQELMPKLALSTSYFRRWFNNFQVTDNQLVTADDFDHYCIVSPPDPRLPGGGGQQQCGLYDINSLKFGQSRNFVTFAKQFGNQTEVYDGVDLTVTARPRPGVMLEGGLDSGRVKRDSCFAIDSPQALRPGFCDVHPPFLTMVKLVGSYVLPWSVQVSGTIQSAPGPEILAAYTARNAEIQPSLGRPLSSGANGTAVVDLVAPGTMFGERLLMFDARAARNFRVGGMRVRGMLDVYNVLNANTVLIMNNTYGSAWQRPLNIMSGRLVKFGISMDF